MFSDINEKLSPRTYEWYAEHRPILKNNQNTYHLRFGFTPLTDIAFPKTGFWFYCVYSLSSHPVMGKSGGFLKCSTERFNVARELMDAAKRARHWADRLSDGSIEVSREFELSTS